MRAIGLVLVVVVFVLCLSMAALRAEAGAVSDGLILQDVFPEPETHGVWHHVEVRMGEPIPLNRLQDVFPLPNQIQKMRQRHGEPRPLIQDVFPELDYRPVEITEGRLEIRPPERPVQLPSSLSLPHPNTTDRLAIDLCLTDNQMHNLAAALVSGHLKLAEISEARDARLAELRKAVLSAHATPTSIKAAQSAVSKAESNLTAAEVNAWLSVRTILNADQMKKLSEMIGK